MIEAKVWVDEKQYGVVLTRFDDDIDIENGASYHGFYLTITGLPSEVTARKYDGEGEVSIQNGIDEADSESISVVREVARQLFNTEKLLLLGAGDPPYTEI